MKEVSCICDFDNNAVLSDFPDGRSVGQGKTCARVRGGVRVEPKNGTARRLSIHMGIGIPVSLEKRQRMWLKFTLCFYSYR